MHHHHDRSLGGHREGDHLGRGTEEQIQAMSEAHLEKE